MTCREAEEAIQSLLDETCDAETRAALDGHTESCASCRRTRRELQGLFAAYANAPDAGAARDAESGSGEGFAAAVMARVHDEDRARALRRKRRRVLFVRLGSPAAAAAVIALALLGSYFWHLGTPGVLSRASGEASIRSAGRGDWSPVRVGGELARGDVLRTGRNARLRVAVGKRTFVDVNAMSEIVAARRDRYDLRRGEAYFEVEPGTSFEVGLPHGRVVVHGTEFNVRVEPEGDAIVTVLSGKVQVESGTGIVRLAESGIVATVLPSKLHCARPAGGVDRHGDWRLRDVLRLTLVDTGKEGEGVSLLPGETQVAGPLEVIATSRGDRQVELTVRNRSRRPVHGVLLNLRSVDGAPVPGMASMTDVRGGNLAGDARVRFDRLGSGASAKVIVKMTHKLSGTSELQVDIEPVPKD